MKRKYVIRNVLGFVQSEIQFTLGQPKINPRSGYREKFETDALNTDSLPSAAFVDDDDDEDRR